jgi:hypothetical protein
MMEIEGAAAPQMDLAMKPKANIISFEDIVTSNTLYYVDDIPRPQVYEEDDEEKA